MLQHIAQMLRHLHLVVWHTGDYACLLNMAVLTKLPQRP
jgi:hypothetical protein